MFLAITMMIWLIARPWLPRKIGLVAEAILVFEWIWAWQQNLVPSLNFYWSYLPLYLMAGVGLYCISCLITGVPIELCESSYRRPALHNSWWWRIVLISPIHEEIIWRLMAQSLLAIGLFQLWNIGSIVVLIVISSCFTLWHRIVWKSPRNAFELMVFSLVLSASITCIGDLLLPVCLHVMRNFLILQRR